MAETTLKTRIQLRSDTLANWEAVKTQVPLKGESCYETDTHKLKIGDGVTTWENLPYCSGTEIEHYPIEGKEGKTDEQLLDEIVAPELHDGDTAVIKRPIAGGKVSYTAYVYDNGAWKAMDGNYSANNVYFDKDLTYTANIGVKTVPSSGSGTIAAEGKNVTEVLASILALEKNPSTTQPTLTLNSSNIGAKEVGTKVKIAYEFKTTTGSYTYGPATGVTWSGYSATFNGQELTTATGTFNEIQVTDTTSLTIAGKATHSAGATPKTNIGNDYAAGKITEKQLTANKGTLTGYRNWFYGYKNAAGVLDVTNLTSANIRALTAQNGSFPGTISTNGMQQMFFAIPKGKKSKVTVSNATNGAPQTVTKVTDIMVEGANGYDAIAYDVWYVSNAAADSGAGSYKIVVG